MYLILATEYPAEALPGEAMSCFATLVREAIGADLKIDCLFEGKVHNSSWLDKRDDSMKGGMVFGASLQNYAKQFELAAIPRGFSSSPSKLDVGRFRRIFQDCLYREGFRLLASVPMPPTGLWSFDEIRNESELVALQVRAYDSISLHVFSAVGCSAVQMSFGQLQFALQRGELNSVLSSGDGSAGLLLSRYFQHYLPIAYSAPLCFLIIQESSLQAMPWRWQRAMKWAGREIQLRYLSRQRAREERNLRAIQACGVRVERNLPQDVMRLLEQKMEVVRRRLIAEHALTDVLVPVC